MSPQSQQQTHSTITSYTTQQQQQQPPYHPPYDQQEVGNLAVKVTSSGALCLHDCFAQGPRLLLALLYLYVLCFEKTSCLQMIPR